MTAQATPRATPDGREGCRDFRAEDQDAVRTLVLEGLQERWGAAFDAAYNTDLDDIAASYLARGAEVVVVERAGALVATGTLVPETDRVGRVVRMSVASTQRRQGLGLLVVAELVARARRRGLVELVVTTDTPWASAIALYRRAGFTQVAQDDIDEHFSMTL